MSDVRVRAAGKVNLQLKVGRPDQDGYHELATVFQAVSLFDILTMRLAPSGRFPLQVSGDQADLVPTDGRNLAIKAIRRLQRNIRHPNGIEIEIAKKIPVTGGMAGGSADAAGALLGACVLWDADCAPDDLVLLGAEIGADVPFCVLGGTALGVHRGEQVTSVLTRGEYHWVLAFSEAELSTPQVFREFDILFPNPPKPVVKAEFLAALAAGSVAEVGARLDNDLQPAVLTLLPKLQRVLDTGREAGALGGLVSGSGPTCAFLAESSGAAKAIEYALTQDRCCRAVQRVRGPVRGVTVLEM